jgi:hypothetical protein
MSVKVRTGMKAQATKHVPLLRGQVLVGHGERRLDRPRARFEFVEAVMGGREITGQLGDAPGSMVRQPPGEQHDRQRQVAAQPNDLPHCVSLAFCDWGATSEHDEQFGSCFGFESVQREVDRAVEGSQVSSAGNQGQALPSRG